MKREVISGGLKYRRRIANYLRRKMKEHYNGWPRNRRETELLDEVLTWVLTDK